MSVCQDAGRTVRTLSKRVAHVLPGCWVRCCRLTGADSPKPRCTQSASVRPPSSLLTASSSEPPSSDMPSSPTVEAGPEAASSAMPARAGHAHTSQASRQAQSGARQSATRA